MERAASPFRTRSLRKTLPDPPVIQYRNTDLDLVTDIDPAPLVAEFESRGLSAQVTTGGCGLWYVICEDENETEPEPEPEPNIVRLLDAVESLSDPARVIWQHCSKCEFDVGYDCGDEPRAFNQALSNDVLRRIAACGATFSITLYPYRPD